MRSAWPPGVARWSPAKGEGPAGLEACFVGVPQHSGNNRAAAQARRGARIVDPPPLPNSENGTLTLSRKNARHIEVFEQYSKLTGITLNDVLDECLGEYIECTIETGLEHVTEQAATT